MTPRSPLVLTVVVCLCALVAACQSPPDPSGSGTGTVDVTVVAGPVCPVEQNPPDPACEPRPVQGARILVQPGDGRDIVVGEATTDADGHASIELPPGEYIVLGTDVGGLMGRPEPMAVTVRAGQAVTVELVYDTGIR
ncbi:MAG TPA: hypothetical protein VFM03_03990 [Candidatus Limnocylindria bacterium]|jgi:hypothetical protein|nr:hypothetical protein [Candidatus Limnocylindria bacterium]